MTAMMKYPATLAAALLLFSGVAHAQLGGRGDAPIFVESDTLQGFQADGRAVYEGNVRATQGDSQLTTDKLTAVCSQTAASSAAAAGACEEIRSLIAENNVLFTAPKLQIKGDRAEYDYPTDTITITGDVIMTRDKEAVIRGKKVVYQVSAGLASISSSGDRVQAILTPQQSDRSAQPAPGQPAPSQPPARPN
jgi:lipopolysaccharide export system protein LptA